MKPMLQFIQWAVDMKLMIQWAVTSSALILIVLAVRRLFREKLSARLKYALWGVVLLRLLVPFQVELPADTSAALPVLASNLAQDVTPWLDDTMLYAIPDKDQPSDDVPAGMPPEYRRNGFPNSDWDYYTGGVVYDGNHSTRYAFMMTVLEVLVLIWIAGTVLTALVILLSNLRFGHRLRKRREPLDIPDSTIPVYTAEGLPSPCLFGVFRPAVYVTPQAAEHPDVLRHVLAHELTHYAHFDHLWSLLRCLALALHWYNPLVWLAVGLSKGDGELACDEGAVARLGEAERIPYGRTLVDMVAARSLRPGDLLSCSTAMTGGTSSIKRRVAQLVKKPETVKTAVFAAAAILALGLVFVFAGRAKPKVNTMFHDQLGLAASIRYSTPAYFSQFYSGPISDPDLLAAAKESLSAFTYLPDGDPGPDLQKGLIHTSRVTLINDRTETVYTLLWQNGFTYLFPGDIWEEEMKLQEEYGEGAHIRGVSGTMRSQPGDNVGSILESLARQQSYRERENLSPASGSVGLSFLDLAPGEECVKEQMFVVQEVLSDISYSLTYESPTLTLDFGLRTADGTEVACHTAYDGVANGTFKDIPAGSYQIFVRNMGDLNYYPQFPAYQPESGRDDAAGAVNFQIIEQKNQNGSYLLGDLTQEQVDRANEAFRPDVEQPDGSWGPSEISCFFTSSYGDPTQIDLEEFLMYCPLREEVGTRVDPEEAKECQAVLEAAMPDVANDPEFVLPTPMWRYPREKVTALLQKYAGVTADELDWSNVTYLEEYDAFYNFTSDYGPGFFSCAGGQVTEDAVLLWSKPNEDGERCELTLRKSGDGWLIQSHHTIYER